MKYIIFNSEESKLHGEKLYWSNSMGWVSPESATVFEQHERDEFNLPNGGVWIPVRYPIY